MESYNKSLSDTQRLLEKCDAKIGIIGLGYVGLPLAVAFSKKMRVFGYDSNRARRNALRNGVSTIDDVPDRVLRTALSKGLTISRTANDLRRCDVIIICVPTPLDAGGYPDLSYVAGAAETVAEVVRPGMLIILESTSYPGTTEEYIGRGIREAGYVPGMDVALAFSPERVDPGNTDFTIANTPKVVGGLDSVSTKLASLLYSTIVHAGVVEVRNCATAEAVKIVENIFRGVNIALVNELALVFEKLGINTWEVVRAAASKPFAFMPHYPGPGVGGHCIPLDPMYLSYKAKQFGLSPRFIELSREVNEFMKMHAVNLTMDAMCCAEIDPEDARVAVMGLAYKKNVSDTRESPSIHIVRELVRRVDEVIVHDSRARRVEIDGRIYRTTSIGTIMKTADCLVFVTDHDEYRILADRILKSPKVRAVVDCRDIFSECDFRTSDVVYKAIGK